MKSNLNHLFVLLCILLFTDILNAQMLITFPDIPGRTSSDKYVCRVRQVGTEEWKDAFVLQTISKPEIKDANGGNLTIRRQAKVQFTFKQPNIIDMDIWVETHTTYPAFEILATAYLAPGFQSGVYVAKEEFGSTDPQQIHLVDQPMIHGIWPFFPRDEAGANLLTDGRHQKGRWFWRMAIGRRYGMQLAFFSKNGVDAILMGRPEDVYAVGATYKGDETNDNVAGHRSLYLSLFGEDFKAGEGRRTQMRMVIGDYGSNPEKHKELLWASGKNEKGRLNSHPFNVNPQTHNMG